MNWFYSISGEKLGPISEAQLDELLGSGKINRDTLVWREGMADWQPLDVARADPTPPASLAPLLTCAECGHDFPTADLIQLNRSWVCAQCKPAFLQRMSEGATAVGAAGSMWRMNKQLVTRSETPFPDRCIKCNAPANGFRLKRVFYWQHPAYYLLLLCNLLVLIIVVLIVRKKAVLHVGVCAKHRTQRKQALLVGWIGALGGIAIAMVGGVIFESTWSVVAGILMFLGAAIFGGLRAPIGSPAKITKENVWVRGVHRDFLADLPEWPGT